jgi:hypothetical protein
VFFLLSIVLFSPYWIMNKTNVSLEYSARQKTDKVLIWTVVTTIRAAGGSSINRRSRQQPHRTPHQQKQQKPQKPQKKATN